MSYRQVDRSDVLRNFDGQHGDALIDIGWAEGTLHDGRPFRMECWSLAGTTGVYFLMSSEGLESANPLLVHALLEESHVLTNLISQTISIQHFVDSVGAACLALSYVVADDETRFVIPHPPLNPYPRAST